MSRFCAQAAPPLAGRAATWEFPARILCRRAVLALLLLGACVNLAFSLLAGYINPRDYVQDVIAAHQFLKHATMYPRDLPRLGIVELSAPVAGRQELERLPIVRRELRTLTEAPASANAHPPCLGIALAGPVRLLGLRGSFVFVFALSVLLLSLSVVAILRELFPALPLGRLCAVMGLLFCWYPVGTALRSGQPGIILLALITAGWMMLRRHRPRLAGGAIGLAACLHVFPALLLLYFAIRSRRAFVSAVGTITLLSAAAAAVTVPATFQQWISTMDMIAQRFVPRAGNLSLAGLITGFGSGIGWAAHVEIVAPAMLLIVSGALALYLWPWNRHSLPPRRLDTEYSVFVAAMLLASPISWGRYLPIMLLPLGVLMRDGRCRRPKRTAALLAALVCLSLPDAAFFLMYNWLTRTLGFAAGWLLDALPPFSILAILLWLGSSARWPPDAEPAEVGPGPEIA